MVHAISDNRRGPGRPSGGGDRLRARLLRVARDLFADRGVSATSLRRIAGEAGSNPAMIHYYFGDKRGLAEAVLDTQIAPIVQSFARILDDESVQEVARLEAFVQSYVETLSANPWLPALLMREVISESGTLGPMFLSRFARHVSARLTRLLRNAQEKEAVRSNLDPRLAVLSLFGLALFPFLARPVARGAMGLDPITRPDLAQHVQAMLLRGIRSEVPA